MLLPKKRKDVLYSLKLTTTYKDRGDTMNCSMKLRLEWPKLPPQRLEWPKLPSQAVVGAI